MLPSPIAYADARPVGYDARTEGGAPRPRVTPDEYARHAERLLALRETKSNLCPHVIITGNKHYPWRWFYDPIKRAFWDQGTIVVPVPFFSRRFIRSSEFAEKLGAPQVRERLLEVVATWAESIS